MVDRSHKDGNSQCSIFWERFSSLAWFTCFTSLADQKSRILFSTVFLHERRFVSEDAVHLEVCWKSEQSSLCVYASRKESTTFRYAIRDLISSKYVSHGMSFSRRRETTSGLEYWAITDSTSLATSASSASIPRISWSFFKMSSDAIRFSASGLIMSFLYDSSVFWTLPR